MAEENIIDIEESAASLEDVKNTEQEDGSANNLIRHVMDRYQKAEDSRQNDEDRWLRAYRNYRGLYGPMYSFLKLKSQECLLR